MCSLVLLQTTWLTLHSRNEASLQSSQSLSPHTSSICMWTWIPLSISKWLCNWHCFKEIQSINLYLLSTLDDSCYVNYQRMINDHVVADTQKIMNNNETVLIYLFRIDHMHVGFVLNSGTSEKQIHSCACNLTSKRSITKIAYWINKKPWII
jgi:hypothetical protein